MSAILARLQRAQDEMAALRADLGPPPDADASMSSKLRGILTAFQHGGTQKNVEDRINSVEAMLKPGNPFPLVRLSGFLQYDTDFYTQDASSKAQLGNVQSGSGFRRARLQALGKVTEFTNFSIEMEFASAGRPSFFDVWGEQTNLPLGAVRIGQFRQPITMDAWTSVRHLEFMERSAPFQAFDPFRRVGIMNWWNSENNRTLIAFSILRRREFVLELASTTGRRTRRKPPSWEPTTASAPPWATEPPWHCVQPICSGTMIRATAAI